jgi:hypothetical protein
LSATTVPAAPSQAALPVKNSNDKRIFVNEPSKQRNLRKEDVSYLGRHSLRHPNQEHYGKQGPHYICKRATRKMSWMREMQLHILI